MMTDGGYCDTLAKNVEELHTLVCGWLDLHSLLNKPMKKKASGSGGTTVEPKRVFLQVVVEMFIPNGPLVGANEPSFQQRSNTVRARQNDTCSRISTARLNTSLMLVSVRRQAVVTGP